jgi:lambda family phage portal protein
MVKRNTSPAFAREFAAIRKMWHEERSGAIGRTRQEASDRRLQMQERLWRLAPGKVTNDYDLARSNRYRRIRTGNLQMGSGADWHIRIMYRLIMMTEQARDMRRNDAAIGPLIDRTVANTVQGGFHVRPKTGDKAVDADLKARWLDWSEDADQCDYAQERSFHDMEWQLVDSVLTDGDMLGVFHDQADTNSIELVESHRLRTPITTRRNVIHGVLLDERRRRLEYWVAQDDVDPLQLIRYATNLTKYPTRDKLGNRIVCHVYNPKRTSQTRGVTALAPVADLGSIFQDLNFAKIVQAQAQSIFGLIEECEVDSSGLPSVDTKLGERILDTQQDGTVRVLEGTAPGMYFKAPPGKKVKAFSAEVPNAEFFPHVRRILQLISINLGLPLCLYLMDGSETNFSGWRGAVDEARRGFRRNQKWLIERFHKPVYQWQVRRWLKTDRALLNAAGRAGIDIYKHVWQPPPWPYIDPRVDAAADALQLRDGLTSETRLFAGRGLDFGDHVQEVIDDARLKITAAIELAAEINKLHPDNPEPVSWREIYPHMTAEGVSASLAILDPATAAAAQAPPADDKSKA